MVRDGVIIFNSVHRVMKAEKLLKATGLDVRIMPVPRQLSSDCGLSIAFRLEDVSGVVTALTSGGLTPEGVYRMSGESFEMVS